jgi:putative flippase GtrA|tara:strand:+ start:32 stop:403 length:372 start_codon:yes stop_codon:yes gene_type:complete
MFLNFKKFIKYFLVGIINTSITYPAFILVSNIIDYTLTIIIIFPLGVLLSYFLNKKFVFNKEKGNIIVFFIVMTTMFLTNFLTTWILVEFVNIIKEISQALAIFMAFIVHYLLNKKFSFKKIS